MNKRKWLLALLALVMILTAAIQPAMAYFTTYTRAKGGYTVYRDATTTIDEQYEDWVKYVTITSVDGEPVFVRARAYTGSEVLKVYIDEVPINPENDLGFDVAVVYESTVALYKPDGSAYAKFDEVLDQGG